MADIIVFRQKIIFTSSNKSVSNQIAKAIAINLTI